VPIDEQARNTMHH